MKKLLTLMFLLFPLIGCAANSGDPGMPPTIEEEVSLETPTGTLRGTLLSHQVSSLRPVALIIAGSGPTDRNGNSPLLPGPNNSLLQLAEGLAARGVASLRYDKRGIAASAPAGPREEDLLFDTLVDDAAGWVELLRQNPRFSSVTVIGHSEGSTIGALATAAAGADAFVSIAGIAQPAAETLRGQLRPTLPPELWNRSEAILGELEAGRTVDDVPAELQMLYRPSVQPYLISWFRVDPARAIAELDVPVMIAHGTADAQVPVAQAHALHAAQPAAKLLVVEGMNHVLKLVTSDSEQVASYSDPSLPVAPILLDSIASFIHSIPDER